MNKQNMLYGAGTYVESYDDSDMAIAFGTLGTASAILTPGTISLGYDSSVNAGAIFFGLGSTSALVSSRILDIDVTEDNTVNIHYVAGDHAATKSFKAYDAAAVEALIEANKTEFKNGEYIEIAEDGTISVKYTELANSVKGELDATIADHETRLSDIEAGYVSNIEVVDTIARTIDEIGNKQVLKIKVNNADTTIDVPIATEKYYNELDTKIADLENNTVSKDDLALAVMYKEFTYKDEKRKTIQLNNYDSISGIDTDGHGHNLVMLSKWNVADFGAAGVEFNINTTADNVVKINDGEGEGRHGAIVATTAFVKDEIAAANETTTAAIEAVDAKVDAIDFEPYATKEAVAEAVAAVDAKVDAIEIPDITPLATKEEVAAVDAKIEALDFEPYATKEALAETNTAVAAVDAKVDALDFEPYATKEALAETNAAVDAVDAKVDAIEIPDIAPLATKEEVAAVDAKVDAIVIPDITPLATKEEVAAVEAKVDAIEMPDLEPYATVTYVDENLTEAVLTAEATYATKEELADEIKKLGNVATNDKIEGLEAKVNDVADKLENLELPDITGLATKEEVAAVEAKIDAIEMPDVTGFAEKAEVEAAINALEVKHDEDMAAAKSELSEKHAADTEALEAKIEGDVANLKDEVDAKFAALDDLNISGNFNELLESIKEIKDGGYLTETAADAKYALITDVNNNATKIGDLESKVAANTTALEDKVEKEELTAIINELKEQIAALNETVATMSGQIVSLKEELDNKSDLVLEDVSDLLPKDED